MTTAAWSTVLDHTSDAGFRAWGSEFSAKMAAVGLVQTADTGQINWTTVTRPGTSTDAGFEIWRFNDSLQGTAPVYIRVNYGTSTSANAPRIQIAVGTGTNGAGTLTGTALTTAHTAGLGSSVSSTTTTYISYMCCVSGLWWFSWKEGAFGAAQTFASCAVMRTCDSAGAPNATGAIVFWGNGASGINFQMLRFASPAATYTFKNTVSQTPCVIPNSPTSSLTSAGANQAYLWWLAVPDVAPCFGICSVIPTEVSQGATFSTVLVGTTARTFIRPATPWAGDPATVGAPALIWE